MSSKNMNQTFGTVKFTKEEVECFQIAFNGINFEQPSTFYYQELNKFLGFDKWAFSIQEIRTNFITDRKPYDAGATCIGRITLCDGSYKECIGHGSSMSASDKMAAIIASQSEAQNDALKRCIMMFTSEFNQKLSMATSIPLSMELDLPAGWIKMVDPSTGRPYYVDESTGQSHWDPPGPRPPAGNATKSNPVSKFTPAKSLKGQSYPPSPMQDHQSYQPGHQPQPHQPQPTPYQPQHQPQPIPNVADHNQYTMTQLPTQAVAPQAYNLFPSGGQPGYSAQPTMQPFHPYTTTESVQPQQMNHSYAPLHHQVYLTCINLY